jgi:RHS repeat-associated protein
VQNTTAPGLQTSFDAQNKLLTAYRDGQPRVSLEYDALDRLTAIQAGAGAAKQWLVWNGDQLAGQLDGGGNLTDLYIYRGDERVPVAWRNGPSGQNRALIQDPGSGPGRATRGSVIALANKASGVERIHLYDEYGNENGAPHLGLFGYTGHVTLPGVGLVHMRARAYDPRVGRFLQPDPIGQADGPNIYAYAGGDPVNAIDEFGLQISDGIPEVTVSAGKGKPMPSPKPISLDLQGAWEDVLSIRTRNFEANPDWEIEVFGKGKPFIVKNGGYVPNPTYKAGRYDNYFDWAAGIYFGGGTIFLVGAEALEVVPAGAKALCCFVQGTLVDTAGGLRPIEAITVGDLVVSRDEATGATALKPVTAITPRHDRVIWKITVETPWDGVTEPESYDTTDEHPWRTLDSRWLTTAELKPSTLLWRETGMGARVIAVANTGEVKPAYNLEVADYHTYFVGKEKLWVHNACDPELAQELAKQAARGSSEARRIMQGLIKDPNFRKIFGVNFNMFTVASTVKILPFTSGAIWWTDLRKGLKSNDARYEGHSSCFCDARIGPSVAGRDSFLGFSGTRRADR